ncbi:aminotransferase class I/II-fold pyridoxal phosphate-dependent enzyme [Hylemonella gracilis]|jgi:histidinol-phosphate aminotransferase|uniref:histidinol-phosphate transaminase n=1 Tax=Hylemonella gracilis TaxID=80880 RepID=A0A4P6UMD2_9BURK|nr:aminotransferase class I/II-fold pyridoxal phosphate-dependent enzyme [Hylemonella gracilis]QBK05350.1 aminotransferase class I/II-fold pyridoxal phosphate-dependent enzyme [Hylemonella gracilis]
MNLGPHQELHGGPDALGVPRFDFSTNANACGPCPQALAAVLQADAAHYPDPSYLALRSRLAEFHGVAPARVLLAASASEFIHRVSAWVAQRGARSVCLPAHSYRDYAAAAQAWGLRSVPSPRDAGLSWACEPSSPLGQAQPELHAWVHDAPLCVLDRAYEPLRLEGVASLRESELDQVWQLWSPNKALGLTGVRAAYVIAPLQADPADPASAPSVAQLEALCSSWPLGAHGVALLQAWTTAEAQAWVRASLLTLQTWKTRQIGLCTALGWRCAPSLANFFCADTGLSAAALAQALRALRARGIKLRDAASFGLPGWVRLGVLAPEAQDALREAWLELLPVRSSPMPMNARAQEGTVQR